MAIIAMLPCSISPESPCQKSSNLLTVIGKFEEFSFL